MREKSVLLVGAIAICLVACDVHIPEHRHNPNALTYKNKETNTTLRAYDDHKQSKRNMLSRSEEEDASKDKHRIRHHHGEHPSEKPPHASKKRKGRCRRYSQRYYQMNPKFPVYVPNYNRNYPAPNYVPPDYLLPTRYYSPMCRSYCVPCITSTCRRRCPNYPTVTVTSTAVTKSTKPTAIITVVTDPRKWAKIKKKQPWSSYFPQCSVISLKILQ